MDNSGIGVSSSSNPNDGKWKWTKTKIILLSVFGVFLLILLFTEVILFETYEDLTDEYQDLEYSPDLYSTSDYSQFDTIEVNDLPPVATGTTGNSLVTRGTQSQTTNQRNEDPPATSNPPSRTIQERTATEESVTEARSPQLKVSDEGEIVEVTQTTENTQQEESSEQETSSTIEEQFYTPVTVTGVITSASDGTALSEVRISVKGTAISTLTDFGGKYAIAVPGNPLYRTLQFSYRGNVSERTVQPDTKFINIEF
ncbi:MAG: carboxypeptidase-like regulatory domain-containing protein [Cyclobacteriaceae bacterium]|nr:carboxypeptidase-like regulatory domain-containing protein [Cyclobacteriaceae bacterium]